MHRRGQIKRVFAPLPPLLAFHLLIPDPPQKVVLYVYDVRIFGVDNRLIKDAHYDDNDGSCR